MIYTKKGEAEAAEAATEVEEGGDDDMEGEERVDRRRGPKRPPKIPQSGAKTEDVLWNPEFDAKARVEHDAEEARRLHREYYRDHPEYQEANKEAVVKSYEKDKAHHHEVAWSSKKRALADPARRQQYLDMYKRNCRKWREKKRLERLAQQDSPS